MLAAATAGNKALFAGGYWVTMNANGSVASHNIEDIVDVFDAETQQWSVQYLSEARWWLAATSVGTKAMFAGGLRSTSGASFTRTVDIYDGADGVTNRWSTALLSEGRGTLAAASVGTKALFAGGHRYRFGIGWEYLDTVDIYDDTDGSWSTAQLSSNRSKIGAATAGTKALFAGGGSSGSTYWDVVDIYDDADGSWSTGALSQAREYITGISVGNKALFAGGRYYDSGTVYSDVVDIYDATSDTWSAATLTQGRYLMAAASLGPYALFAGGQIQGSSSDVIDVYDSRTGQWSTLELSLARSGLAGTTVGDYAIFAGGSGAGSDGEVDIYRIPEPGTLTMCLLGLPALVRRRARARRENKFSGK